ncbi:MAG: DNA methyltransferase [Candidatus Pacebacteria bacterium]|nr:DNA methyltransferase [Candidatus Paceibacterota bacterium]
MSEESEKIQKDKERIESRTEVVGKQATLGGENIELREFKNLKEKRELKEQVLSLFNNEMIRSIIVPREIDNNIRGNKLDRQYARGRDVNDTMSRADMFAKKDILTLSTFPATLTMAYVNLLTKEGDSVFDAFMGHNSRAEDVLSLGRKYYGYDIHSFPVEFTKKAIERFPQEDWELNYGSSEKVKYEDESMDFSLTCPPYFDVEPYNKIYGEEKQDDLSSKDDTDFIFSYYQCIKETYRVLKKGSYFVIIVGDTHKGEKYRSLMLETIKICSILGFQLHDINIYNRKSNIGGDMNYKNFILKSKRFPTIHEFILIFKK